LDGLMLGLFIFVAVLAWAAVVVGLYRWLAS
jgi:hypothetical protein